MTHWNYRLVRKAGGDEPFFEIHEVYYDDAGEPTGMTDSAVSFGGESVADVAGALEMALRDVRERPIFDPPTEWTKSSTEPERG